MRVPVRAARIGIKSKTEANQVWAELVNQVESKVNAQIIPKWGAFLQDFLQNCRERGLKEKQIPSSISLTPTSWPAKALLKFTLIFF